MSPEGEVKLMSEFEKETGKSEEELKEEGYISLSPEEEEMMMALPEDKRRNALIAKRHGDVRKAAMEAQRAERSLNAKAKNKNRQKMIKKSKRQNRKRR